MTLKELYDSIEGDYEQATRVLRVEKLIDKHIRRLSDNAIFPELFDAVKTMDATRLFESAHAVKGVCGNLGLVRLSKVASEISEEFRPGNPRTMSDEEVEAKVNEARALFEKAADGIRKYSNEGQN